MTGRNQMEFQLFRLDRAVARLCHPKTPELADDMTLPSLAALN